MPDSILTVSHCRTAVKRPKEVEEEEEEGNGGKKTSSTFEY